MAKVGIPYYSVDDYLRFEAHSAGKHEYYRGVIYAHGDLVSDEELMATVPVPYYTVDQYLAREATALEKSEYYRGVIYAMAGAKPNHAEISINIASLMKSLLRGGPCRIFSSELRVKTKDDLYTYPDLTVVCQEPVYEMRQGLETLMNPTLLVEITSPSTAAYDRGDKLRLYQELDSLQDYLIVAQNISGVDHYTRQGDGWLLKSYRAGEKVNLTKMGIQLPLAEIYDNVIFPSPIASPPDLHVVRDYKPEA